MAKTKNNQNPPPQTPNKFVHNNTRVSDLITHKQKQIQKNQLKNKYSYHYDLDNCSSNQQSFNQQFQNYQNQNLKCKVIRYQKKSQRQNKQKLLQNINKLMAKNKINAQTAFDVPILSIQDFKIYDTDQYGQFAWNKLSSIIENGSKIFGIRVQSMQDFITKIQNTLYRNTRLQTPKSHHDNSPDPPPKNPPQNPQQQNKSLPDSLSIQDKYNLTIHLQKNSQNLDLNFKKKFITRKDPLFQQNSKIFDYSTFNCFFLNTLSLNQGLMLEINASEYRPVQNGTTSKQNQNITQKQHSNIISTHQITSSITKSHQLSQLNPTLTSITKLPKTTSQFQLISDNINKIQKSIKYLTNQYDQYQQQNHDQNVQNYQHIVNLILQVKFKAAFQTNYIDSDDHQFKDKDQQQNQSIILQDKDKKPLKRPKQLLSQQKKLIIPQNQIIQFQNPATLQQKLIYNQNEQFQPHNAQKQNKKLKNTKYPIKTKKIKQYIKIKSSIINNQLNIKTRNKKLTPFIQNIISTEKKSPLTTHKQQKTIFNPQKKQSFIKVFKKQKLLKNKSHHLINTYYPQKNIIPSSISSEFNTFNIKYFINLRPTQTPDDVKRQKILEKQRYLQSLQNDQNENNINIDILPNTSMIQNIKSPEQHENIEIKWIQRKQQKMQTIKKQIRQILKQHKKITFKNMIIQYNQKNRILSPSTLFIAILHVTNQGFIKVTQLTNKNFIIQL